MRQSGPKTMDTKVRKGLNPVVYIAHELLIPFYI